MSKDTNDVNVQLKDFFRSGDYGKHQYPQNANNILYMVSLADISFFPKGSVDQEYLKRVIKNKADSKENIKIESYMSKINDNYAIMKY